MKKALALLALLAAACCLLTFSAAAESAAASGICGENLTWTLDAAGTLTVSGTGAMKNYNYMGAPAPWYQSRDSIKAVVVESGVTTIGRYAFYDCSSLTGITLPEGVTTIDYSAFSGCTSLTSITIPESVTTIDWYAFYDCSSLTSVTFAENSQLATIGDYAFEDCSSLSSITIPESVTSIGKYAFQGCRSLSSITIPEGVTAIGEHAFSDCFRLISITIPESVTAIGDYAFYFCSLTSINIPESVTAIGRCAFNSCYSLTSINIPEGVTTIGDSVFRSCSRLTSITIPESVTTIGHCAFYDCCSLTSINIPESVTAIGEDAFSVCSRLTAVYITDLAAWCNIAFGNEKVNPLYEAENLYLNGELVETLEIPEGVTVIQPNVFRGATCIQRVALPKGLKGVAANAFYGCTNIKEVFYAGSEAEWKALPIAAGNDPLKNATIYFNSTIDDYYCRITVVASEGGRVAVSANTAKAGDTVTVTATPYRGYVMSAIYVDGAEISGDTFTVTGNHRVSAVFTRLPIVGGNEDFRLEGITVLDGAGNPLQELPAERLLVTVTVRHLKESGSGAVMLAQYDERGRYQGLLWLTLEEMPQDMTLKVTLPVDNTGGSIAQLKVFLVESLFSPAPVGEAISFGTI